MSFVPYRHRTSRAGSRLLPVAVSLLMLAALAACGDDDPDSTAPPTALSATAEAPAATAIDASPVTSASPSVIDAAPPVTEIASPVASPDAAPTPIAPIELTPGPDVTAEQVLRFGAGRVANLKSAHFKATIEGTVYIDNPRTLQLVSAEGNVVRPDRVQTQFRLRIGDQAITDIRLVTVGGDAWMTDIVTGEWVPALVEFGYDASILFDPEDGLAPVMLGVENPVLTGAEDVGDRTAYVVEATGDEELIGPVTSHTLTGYPVTVRAWVDQETGDLLRIVLIEQPSPENSDPSTWTLELSQFDAEITIEPPESAASSRPPLAPTPTPSAPPAVTEPGPDSPAAIGSTRADAYNSFGQPVQTEVIDQIGFADFASGSAGFVLETSGTESPGDLMIDIIIYAPSGDTWSMDEAMTIAEGFLPLDAEPVGPIYTYTIQGVFIDYRQRYSSPGLAVVLQGPDRVYCGEDPNITELPATVWVKLNPDSDNSPRIKDIQVTTQGC